MFMRIEQSERYSDIRNIRLRRTLFANTCQLSKLVL